MVSTFIGVLGALLVVHALDHQGLAAAMLTTLGLGFACGVIDLLAFGVRRFRGPAAPRQGKP